MKELIQSRIEILKNYLDQIEDFNSTSYISTWSTIEELKNLLTKNTKN
jgi:hypothetical protein